MYRCLSGVLLFTVSAILNLAYAETSNNQLIEVSDLTTSAEQKKLTELADVGRQVANVCVACHSVEKNKPHKIGPNLWDLATRSIASAEGFQYSKALKSKQGRWSYQKLDSFLRQPAAFAPGNKMPFPGIDNVSKRAAIIVWLSTLGGSERKWQIPINDLLSVDTLVSNNKLLKPGKGSAIVGAVCAGCHSLRLVVQQGMNRERWEETLDWMVEEQEMDSLPADDKNVILDYLSIHYGE